MGKHLVLVGAGQAHLGILKDLPSLQMQGHTVTVVNAGAYHYYSGLGPGMLAGKYRPEDARIHVKKMVEDSGGTFIHDTVTRLDPAAQSVHTQSGQQIAYDVVSCNVGSYVPVLPEMTPGDAVFAVKPIEQLVKARKKIIKLLRQRGQITITVVGGGAAGVEIAGNLRALVDAESGQAAIHLIAGERLLDRFPKRARRYALEALTDRRIDVREGVRVERFAHGLIVLSDQTSFQADVCLLAIGTRPSPLFVDSGLPTAADGGLLVNQYLQSPAYPNVFGGGDCVGFQPFSFQPRPLEWAGVYAARQSPVLGHNVLAALNDDSCDAFVPPEAYLLILNMGDGAGILWRDIVWRTGTDWRLPVVLRGKPIFWLKHFLDTAFMRKFQVSGEREEQET